jgi:hypothetical protein
MMLTNGHRHELPNAFVQCAVGNKVGSGAPRGTDAFILERRPLTKRGRSVEINWDFFIRHVQRFAFLFFAIFLRGFFAALELTYARRGIGLFFSAPVFLGVGFANISVSFALKIARLDASRRLFIAAIIFSRTDLALAIAPTRMIMEG